MIPHSISPCLITFPLSCDSSDMTLGISALVPHWTMEAHVVVHLDDRAAWRDVRTGRLSTNSDMRACLSALDALLLRGSYYAGAERTFLKNVTLTGPQTPNSAASVREFSPTASSPAQASSPSSDVSSSSRDNLVLQVAVDF